jgi:hypothetical protein
VCKYIIQYSIVLCLEDGLVILFYGSSILLLEAVINFDGSFTAPSIVHLRTVYKLHKKLVILVLFYLKGM